MRISTLTNNGINEECNGVLMGLTGFLTVILAVVFIVSGIYKWIDPIAFQVSVLHLDLFPEWMVTPLVYGIPIIEILFGLTCLTIRFQKVGYYLLSFLTIAYTVLLLVGFTRGISPGCGCFGSQSAHWPYWALFTRNLGLLVIECFLIRADALHSLVSQISQRRLRLSQ